MLKRKSNEKHELALNEAGENNTIIAATSQSSNFYALMLLCKIQPDIIRFQ
jgi:hypothetical protein